jgi:hypothetical protein
MDWRNGPPRTTRQVATQPCQTDPTRRGTQTDVRNGKTSAAARLTILNTLHNMWFPHHSTCSEFAALSLRMHSTLMGVASVLRRLPLIASPRSTPCSPSSSCGRRRPSFSSSWSRRSAPSRCHLAARLQTAPKQRQASLLAAVKVDARATAAAARQGNRRVAGAPAPCHAGAGAGRRLPPGHTLLPR